MKPSHESSDPNLNSPSHQAGEPLEATDLEFEQGLEEVERSLDALRERYSQIQADQQQQTELQQQYDQLQQSWRQTHLPALKTELKRIQEQIDALEIQLESRLLSWDSFRELFWQILRFGGVGMVVGWLLTLYTLKNPTPTAEPAASPTPSSSPYSPTP